MAAGIVPTALPDKMMDPKILEDLVIKKMPFGKYKDTPIYRLPMHYLEWFVREGLPEGKLGMWMSTIYEIKLNGLEYLLTPIIQSKGKHR